MDQAIGRLQASLASVTNEVTFAAANLNFDFTLVKFEAPKEYQPLGQLLSAQRKRDAEGGKCHITARRLAALFEGVCPKTPALVKAYGTRASEIAKEAISQVPKDHFDSIFSNYTGFDATSMWAAATSSKDSDGGAIHVHLLACLLASAWDTPEATSIWAELVAERRREVALKVERGEPVSFALASAAVQQDIPREQLAEWDASARSWLETADSVKKRQQTQVRLILRNIETSIGLQTAVYTNVVEAWTTAISTMDSLVSGMPLQVSDGSTILALSAWHLYPDMHFFGPKNVEIEMGDPLIPAGGILTLGCKAAAEGSPAGVTWSLCLSKMRHYGEPALTTSSMEGNASRLSVDEFRLVIIGSLLRIWAIQSCDIPLAIRTLEVWSLNTLKASPKDRGCWGGAAMLIQEAMEHYHRLGPDDASTFINLGINRPTFGSKNPSKQPFFGLLHTDALIASLDAVQDKEQGVCRLREKDPSLQGAFGLEDLLWALDKMRPESLVWRQDRDGVASWLQRWRGTLLYLATLSDPFINVQTLDSDGSIPGSIPLDFDLYRHTEASKGQVIWENGALLATRTAFSLLAYFLTGSEIRVDSRMAHFTGISFNNSIYVPTQLLRDPLSTWREFNGITRLLGNVGHPGLVVFSSVHNPMTAPRNDSFWRVVSLNTFDGQPVNLFESTSMHLGFTAWKRSLDELRGARIQDAQYTKMESVISVRDAGRWLGDVDVITELASPYIETLRPQRPCTHDMTQQTKPAHSLKSIESWDELQECQAGPAVVRVHGNWVARLAVTAFLAKRAESLKDKGPAVVLLPLYLCWRCLPRKENCIYIY